MSLTDSLMVALFGFSVVFLVLILLSVLVKLQSMIIGYITMTRQNEDAAQTESMGIRDIPVETETAAGAEIDEGWSTGDLKLLGVDEKTAAMIMAIVSHESQTPLSELQFKMIRAID